MDHDCKIMLLYFRGLRISSSKAPHNGYAYGKGLYFANAFATSEGYSCGTPEKLMLLCKSAIGRLGTFLKLNESPSSYVTLRSKCIYSELSIA